MVTDLRKVKTEFQIISSLNCPTCSHTIRKPSCSSWYVSPSRGLKGFPILMLLLARADTAKVATCCSLASGASRAGADMRRWE